MDTILETIKLNCHMRQFKAEHIFLGGLVKLEKPEETDHFYQIKAIGRKLGLG